MTPQPQNEINKEEGNSNVAGRQGGLTGSPVTMHIIDLTREEWQRATHPTPVPSPAIASET